LFISALAKVKNQRDFGFNILTALKGWVGYAPQGRGALHNKKILKIFNLRFEFPFRQNLYYQKANYSVKEEP